MKASVSSLRSAAFAALFATSHGCSNLLITPGASADGSSMISYNADSGTLYGSLYHYPASTNADVSIFQDPTPPLACLGCCAMIEPCANMI